jgi:tripartite-type tricarboxylate transporter receptor subunit TctC
LLPDVPPLTEQGIDMVMNGWHGLVRARSRRPTPSKIEKDAKRALTDSKWLDLLVQDGSEPLQSEF